MLTDSHDRRGNTLLYHLKQAVRWKQLPTKSYDHKTEKQSLDDLIKFVDGIDVVIEALSKQPWEFVLIRSVRP